jgi:hypothetical protein
LLFGTISTRSLAHRFGLWQRHASLGSVPTGTLYRIYINHGHSRLALSPSKMAAQAVARDAQPRLISIPLEVLLQITSNLTTPEYGNLRCTCKQIEATLFNSFSREFFAKRQFMFTEFSLQALVDISKSRLSSCLSHVILGLERPSLRQLPPPSPLVYPPVWPRNNRFLQECVDHMSFIDTCQDVEMLTEAFSNLRNLETIGMRDFYSRSRNETILISSGRVCIVAMLPIPFQCLTALVTSTLFLSDYLLKRC